MYRFTYLTTALEGCPKNETADTTKSVDTDLAHVVFFANTGK